MRNTAASSSTFSRVLPPKKQQRQRQHLSKKPRTKWTATTSLRTMCHTSSRRGAQAIANPSDQAVHRSESLAILYVTRARLSGQKTFIIIYARCVADTFIYNKLAKRYERRRKEFLSKTSTGKQQS
uniref:Uncharacterized protein n=1 Tax=Trichogramma kaykai TaxID=54128 RepID=A0ABD2XEW6_9HYME